MKRLAGAAFVAAAALTACGGGSGPSQDAEVAYAMPEPSGVQAREPAPAGASAARLDGRLRDASGTVEVWVSLEQASLADAQATLAEAAGLASARRAALAVGEIRQALATQRRSILSQQAGVSSELTRLGATELGRVNVAHNAIAVRIDASRLASVAAIGGVLRVRPVIHYQHALPETVPYVGGAAVQASGTDGTGVTVAVLDSGIDYTHRNLGGAGTAPAYAAAYGTSTTDPLNTTRDGLFPTAKVIEGFDFVGEAWPNGPRTEDPDPIDLESHGTHVADIIAGRSTDGTHRGMAPGAKLLAVKVCSAVATSCNGVALLKGMDYALDPNGDGDLSDSADVINLSLGSGYGQPEDDLSFAATNAVRAGVVVVASAGNAANLPYVAGSPSTAVGVLSVAQTQVPSARTYPLTINSPASAAGVFPNTETLEFAPVGAGATGDVVFVGRGCPADSIAAGSPEDAYLASPAGKIALIDRGACSVSLKVDRAAKAGATAVLIGLVAAGDAVPFSYGGGDTFVPSLVIQQSLASSIKTALGSGPVNVSFSPAASIATVGGIVGSSSRGPAHGTHHIKPEIGAPGASVSAQAATGNGETAFGGTSGAAPMVAGAAALLVQQHPRFSPERIKALLMNSAETAVYSNPALLPGRLAPITRTGAGELRVARAAALTSLVWNRETRSAALSFGAVEADEPMVLTGRLRVENFGKAKRVFRITPSFRYADDEASGAVRVLAPGSVAVSAGGHEDIEVRLVIDPSRLSSWLLNGGSRGGRGDLLDGPEFDGYLTFTDGSERLSVPWHVLPRKAADTSARPVVKLRNSDGVPLVNTGAEAGDFEVFSQTGSSPKLPRTELPKPGDNFAIVDLRAVGVRVLPDLGGLVQFAITTYGRRSHPNYPAEFDVYVDSNNDGTPDFVIFNAENGGFTVTGQNVVAIADLATGATSVYFFNDADLNSANVILTVPAAAIGVAPGTTFGFSAYAFDNYFTGVLTDSIENMLFTPGQARYETVGSPSGRVPAGTTAAVPVRATTVPATASSETGLLFLYRRNAGDESGSVKLR